MLKTFSRFNTEHINMSLSLSLSLSLSIFLYIFEHFHLGVYSLLWPAV